MNQQQAEDELREFIRTTQQLADLLRDKFLEWVYAVDPDKLSADEAARLAGMLRRLREVGAIRGH
jgi:hypothetical protein